MMSISEEVAMNDPNYTSISGGNVTYVEHRNNCALPPTTTCNRIKRVLHSPNMSRQPSTATPVVEQSSDCLYQVELLSFATACCMYAFHCFARSRSHDLTASFYRVSSPFSIGFKCLEVGALRTLRTLRTQFARCLNVVAV